MSPSFRSAFKAGRQSFRNVTVVPQTNGDRHRGGPVWPNFYVRVRPRTCWGPLPIPIDRRPITIAEPVQTIEAGLWCGLVGLHYGHMVADFGMRIAASRIFDTTLPLIFSLPDVPGYQPPVHFWQMLEAFGVDRSRLVLVTEPIRVGLLHVFPQAERLYGGGPSRAHLDLMDRLVGPDGGPAKDIEVGYVSRSRVMRGGQIAGESYIEDCLTSLGVQIFYPEAHSVAEQIAFYRRTRRLIFSEGSAVHTLQLLGRVDIDVAILARRPRRWLAIASLRPRARSLTYLHAVEALIRGLGPSRRSQRHRGISILAEDKLLRAFRSMGLDLAPVWNENLYRARRNQDIEAWIDTRKRQPNTPDEKEFVDLQLASLLIPIQY